MVDIRAIQAHEAATFLRVLCEVFGLDFDRALPVFFAEPFFDLDRKWAYFRGAEMVSVLTTTPLEFGFGNAVGIAGVATLKSHQGQGAAGELLAHVLQHGEAQGEAPTLLFAHQTSLYSRFGFEEIDRVQRGKIDAEFQPAEAELEHDAFRKLYESWAAESPLRLRRNDQRWKFWSAGFRRTVISGGGLLTLEHGAAKEAFGPCDWRGAGGLEWVGLKSMTQEFGVPLKDATEDMMLMARGFPGQPQMFMTDQF